MRKRDRERELEKKMRQGNCGRMTLGSIRMDEEKREAPRAPYQQARRECYISSRGEVYLYRRCCGERRQCAKEQGVAKEKRSGKKSSSESSGALKHLLILGYAKLAPPFLAPHCSIGSFIIKCFLLQFW